MHVLCPRHSAQKSRGEPRDSTFLSGDEICREPPPADKGKTCVWALGGEMGNPTSRMDMAQGFCQFPECWGYETEAGAHSRGLILSSLRGLGLPTAVPARVSSCFPNTAPWPSGLEAPFEIDETAQKHLDFGDMEGTADPFRQLSLRVKHRARTNDFTNYPMSRCCHPLSRHRLISSPPPWPRRSSCPGLSLGVGTHSRHLQVVSHLVFLH